MSRPIYRTPAGPFREHRSKRDRKLGHQEKVGLATLWMEAMSAASGRVIRQDVGQSALHWQDWRYRNTLLDSTES